MTCVDECQHRYGYACLLRWTAPFLSIVMLAGCGTTAESSLTASDNVAAATQPTPTILIKSTASPEPTKQVMSTPLIVPEDTITVEVAGVEWQLPQPRGEEPLVAADNQGVLWVRFPPLETGTDGLEEAGIIPRNPMDSYRIMYTPQRPEGGPLEQNAEEIFEIPHQVESNDDDFSQIQYTTSLNAIQGNYFLLGTYTITDHAVNGGTTRMLWIDTATNTMKTVLEAQQGGGKHLTRAYNERWLFWSTTRTGTITEHTDAEAFLADLTTGEVTAIDLGESDWAALAYWGDDGKLYFEYDAQSIEQYQFDPLTGMVQPAVQP
ncbi:MAG: hypothetical protein AAGF95_12715 [Chloroflexota bacterium]